MISPPSYDPPARSTGTTRITLPGDLLSTNVNAFRDEVMPLCEQLKVGQILVIDLRAARLVDSVGLNALVTAIKAAKARAANVRLLIAQPSVRRILSFTRIDTHAEVVGSEQP